MGESTVSGAVLRGMPPGFSRPFISRVTHGHMVQSFLHG